MEAAPANANKNITCNTFSVTVTPITNIRTELKLFSAVYTLKNSAMKQYILDPLAHVAPREPPQFADFRYLGYVSGIGTARHQLDVRTKKNKVAFLLYDCRIR